MNERQIENFHKRIDKKEANECWNWKSKIDRYGYGEFRYMQDGKYHYKLAHRLALFFTGVDVTGHLVLHSCDNRKCCNPNHLRCGTHQENMNDMKQRGRSLKGKKKPKHVITITHSTSTETSKNQNDNE